jgi:acetylornithine deacetylase/succinyl-diaminopimelate desuccinylase-like protein
MAIVTPDERRVFESVDGRRAEAVSLLAELVRIDSTNPCFSGVRREDVLGGETRVSEVLAEHLTHAAVVIDWVAPDPRRANLVATLQGAGRGRSLILNGHSDTVPAVSQGSWKTGGPWLPEVHGGSMYGLGTTDMKGGLVAGWLALRALLDAAIRLEGTVTLQVAVGEETMQHTLGTTACLEHGPKADGAVVLEPSSIPRPLSVSPISAGNLGFGILVRGLSTHAGNRSAARKQTEVGYELGANAVEKGLIVVQALQELEEEWAVTKHHPAFEPGFFSILPSVFHADAGVPSPAYFADHASIKGLLWYPPDEPAEAIMRDFEGHVVAATQRDSWLRTHPPQIEWLSHWPPADTPWEHPLVQTLKHAHERATGEEAPGPEHGLPIAFGAVSDATFFQRAGVPSVVYGPGDIRFAHATDERISIDEIVLAAKTLALMMLDWCGHESA